MMFEGRTGGRLLGVGILTLVLCTFTSRTPLGPLLAFPDQDIEDHDKIPKPSKRMFPSANLTIPVEREPEGTGRELFRWSFCKPPAMPSPVARLLCLRSRESTKPLYLRLFEVLGCQNTLAPPFLLERPVSLQFSTC